MDKKIAGLLGAVAALATIGSAQADINPAAVPDALQASSYADLLTPIAHPIALLKADDAARSQSRQRSRPQISRWLRRTIITIIITTIPIPGTITTTIIITTARAPSSVFLVWVA